MRTREEARHRGLLEGLGTPFVLWESINERQESRPDPALPIRMLQTSSWGRRTPSENQRRKEAWAPLRGPD